MRERILRSDADLAALLELYGKVRADKRVPNDDTNPLVSILRLSGVARVERGLLKVRNRIYERVFDREWVRMHMPDAELLWQRMAYRRGMQRAAMVGASVVVVMAALAVTALTKANQAKEATELANSRSVVAKNETSRANKAADSLNDSNIKLRVALTDVRSQKTRAVNAESKERVQKIAAQNAGALAQARRLIAEQKTEESNERLVALDVATGARFAEEGNPTEALLWFAEARKYDKKPARDAMHRFRFAETLQECPKPTHVWFHDDLVYNAEFSLDGTRVVSYSADSTARVWDVVTGKPITPPIQAGRRSGTTRYRPGADSNWGDARFSPDGRRVLTASWRGGVRVWDAASGRPITPPMPPDSLTVRMVEDAGSSASGGTDFSPDGRLVATGGQDGIARIWDASTGKPISPPIKHKDGVYWEVFSPDGKRLATSSDRDGVKIWEVPTARQLLSIPLRNAREIGFSPDGRRILAEHENTGVKVWDASTGIPVTPSWSGNGDIPHVRSSTRIDRTFSPDGRRIVASGIGGTARVWDVVTGKLITPPLQHGADVKHAEFSPDGRLVLTASYDHTARVWDAVTGRAVTQPLRHQGPVLGAQFSPDGRYVVTASGDWTARLWKLSTREPTEVSIPNSDPLVHRAFSPNGKRIVSRNRGSRSAQIWDTVTGRPVTPPMKHSLTLMDASFSPDGGRLITGSGDGSKGELRIWDATTGRAVSPYLKHLGRFTRVSFSPDGRRIVTSGEGNVVEIWDAVTFKRNVSLRHNFVGTNAEFSPDSRKIVTTTTSNSQSPQTARVWDVETGRLLVSFQQKQQYLNCAHFSRDGRFIVTASGADSWSGGDVRGEAQVWDAVTGRPLCAAIRHESGVSSASFSPDGSRIVTASDDCTARIWDVATGLPVTPPLQHGREGVSDASFSPDGRLLITSSGGAHVRVWDASTGQPLIAPKSHDGGVAAFSPDGSRFVTCSNGKLTFHNIRSDSRPGEDMVLLASLLCGYGVDKKGGHAPLDSVALRKAWTTLRAKYSADFAAVTLSMPWKVSDVMETATRLVRKGQLQYAARYLTQEIEDRPNEGQLYFGLGQVLHMMQRWRTASAIYRKAITHGNDALLVVPYLAKAELAAGDVMGYRNGCRYLLDHIGKSERPIDVNNELWTCAVGANAVTDFSDAIRKMEMARTTEPKNYFILNTLGCILYRAGRSNDAIACLNEAIPLEGHGGNAFDYVFLVMAHYKLGRTDEARAWMAKAAKWKDESEKQKNGDTMGPGFSWSDRQELELLLKEAATLLRQ